MCKDFQEFVCKPVLTPFFLVIEESSGKSKTWKGKFGMSKKNKSGGRPSVERIATVPEVGGMFGAPLDDCVPSPNNEVCKVN